MCNINNIEEIKTINKMLNKIWSIVQNLDYRLTALEEMMEEGNFISTIKLEKSDNLEGQRNKTLKNKKKVQEINNDINNTLKKQLNQADNNPLPIQIYIQHMDELKICLDDININNLMGGTLSVGVFNSLSEASNTPLPTSPTTQLPTVNVPPINVPPVTWSPDREEQD